jgi:hypothetical protein
MFNTFIFNKKKVLENNKKETNNNK